VGVVFTDIQSSTVLWEQHPQGMYDGLKIHNKVLRDTAGETNGYEVKVIGDAMMLAFSSPSDAVEFGLEAHQRLLMTEWPDELCLHPLCRLELSSDGEVVWHGVRIRIGINWGPVRTERNPVTDRYDYFGHTVNVASRVQDVLRHGGFTGMTLQAMNALETDLRDRAGVKVVEMGELELRGTSENVSVFVVLPVTLSDRWHLCTWSAQGTATLASSPALSELSRSAPANSEAMLMWRNSTGHAHRGWGSPRSGSPTSSPTKNSPRLPTNPLEDSKFALGLEPSFASTVTVRGVYQSVGEDDAAVSISDLLLQTETAALRTQGVIMAVISALSVTSWNAVNRTTDHVGQCAHFISLTRHRSVAIGAATGRVLSGNILAFRRRHVTVAGRSIELSITLSEAAVPRVGRILACGEVAELLGEEGLVFLSERWSEQDGGGLVDVWSSDVSADRESGNGEITRLFAAGLSEWPSKTFPDFEPSQAKAVTSPYFIDTA